MSSFKRRPEGKKCNFLQLLLLYDDTQEIPLRLWPSGDFRAITSAFGLCSDCLQRPRASHSSSSGQWLPLRSSPSFSKGNWSATQLSEHLTWHLCFGLCLLPLGPHQEMILVTDLRKFYLYKICNLIASL